MTAAAVGALPREPARLPRPLHVVQVSRDVSLLDDARGAEPRARQRAYVRELDAIRPGSRMTILVLGCDARAAPRSGAGWTIRPLAGRAGGLLRLLPALLRVHRARPIDVVTTQSPLEELWITLAFAWLRSVRVVAQIHFDPFAPARGRGPRALLRRVRLALALRSLRWAHGVRVVNGAVAREMRARGLHPRVEVIPVPVAALEALRPAVPRSEAMPVQGTPRILFVGRLAPEKNLGRWLEVAARVVRAEPEAVFEIVGEGPCEAALRTRARALGVEHNLRLHGFRPSDELDAFYRHATALLLTSDEEGFGRVLVEAAAAGTPCVATRTAGAFDAVAADETGFLHAHDDVDGMAASLVRLIRDPALRGRMGWAASGRARRRFAPVELRRAWIGMLVGAARPDLGVLRTPRVRTARRWLALAFSPGSLLRCLEYEAIRGLRLDGRTLDLGGGGRSDYRSLLDVRGELHSANLDPRTEPTHLVDLEQPLPIGDAAYDHVLSLNTFEHLERDESALGEALRVLRPGGDFHVVVPFLYRVHGSPRDYHRRTPEGWTAMLLRCGADPDTLSIEPLVWDRGGTAISFFSGPVSRVLRPLVLLPSVVADLRHGRAERLPDRGGTRRVVEVALGWYISGTRRGDS